MLSHVGELLSALPAADLPPAPSSQVRAAGASETNANHADARTPPSKGHMVFSFSTPGFSPGAGITTGFLEGKDAGGELGTLKV